MCYLCIYFNVIDPPEITDISSNQTKNEGDVLTLTCTAYGDPTPNITWTRVSDNSVVAFPLTISGKQDEGVYKCTADNDVGNAATRNVNVFVQSESVGLCYQWNCHCFCTFWYLWYTLEELLLLISSFMNFYLKLVAMLLQRSQECLFYPIDTTVGSISTFLHS